MPELIKVHRYLDFLIMDRTLNAKNILDWLTGHEALIFWLSLPVFLLISVFFSSQLQAPRGPFYLLSLAPRSATVQQHGEHDIITGGQAAGASFFNQSLLMAPAQVLRLQHI